MTAAYSYPEAEYCPKLDTPAAILADELRLYPTAGEYRASIRGLSEQYRRVKLGTSFVKVSRMVRLAEVDAGKRELTGDASQRRAVDPNFYAGTMLGMHSYIRPLYRHQRKWLYDSEIKDLSYDIDVDDAGQAETFKTSLQTFGKFYSGGWEKPFRNLHDDVQYRVYEAAVHMYEDGRTQTQAIALEDAFMAGYTYAATTIGQLVVQQPRSFGTL